MNRAALIGSIATLVLMAGCGGGSMGNPPPPGLSISLSTSTAKVFQGEAAAGVEVSVTRNGTMGDVTLSVTGVPSGATVQVQSPRGSDSGTVAIDPGTAAAGDYPVNIAAAAGPSHASAALTLTIGAVVGISGATDGRFELAMSTSFQPAEWDYQFFQNHPAATSALANLLPQHIRLQPLSQAIPQKTAALWDFTMLDAITQPVLELGDHSPEFQIAKAPPFMYAGNDSNGTFLDLSFQQFAAHAQNLVRYYNTGADFKWEPQPMHRRARIRSRGGAFTTSRTSTIT